VTTWVYFLLCEGDVLYTGVAEARKLKYNRAVSIGGHVLDVRPIRTTRFIVGVKGNSDHEQHEYPVQRQ
jgi:hypothetical protein